MNPLCFVSTYCTLLLPTPSMWFETAGTLSQQAPLVNESLVSSMAFNWGILNLGYPRFPWLWHRVWVLCLLMMLCLVGKKI